MLPTAILDIENITVRFGGIQAISDLTLSVHEHELVSLIGPNGAGKTTAFNAISGFIRPSSGVIKFYGRHLNGLKPYQVANLGLVRTFQKTSLFEQESVFRNVLIALHGQGCYGSWEALLALPRVAREEAEMRDMARDILEFIGLTARARDLAGALPYGEQRLLGVAVALAAKPKLIMLDEPVSGMNPSETGRFIEMLQRLRHRGMSVLLVEHDMRMVMSVSDRVIVLNSGRVIAEGSASDIQKNPEVIRIYLGQGVKVA